MVFGSFLENASVQAERVLHPALRYINAVVANPSKQPEPSYLCQVCNKYILHYTLRELQCGLKLKFGRINKILTSMHSTNSARCLYKGCRSVRGCRSPSKGCPLTETPPPPFTEEHGTRHRDSPPPKGTWEQVVRQELTSQRPPPRRTEQHTGVKTLPCPKLRL